MRSKIIASLPILESTTISSNTNPEGVSSPRSPACNITNSDDSEGLITTIKRGTKSCYNAFEEVSMSGALASDDTKGFIRSRPFHGRQMAALLRVARDADHVHAIEGLKKRRDKALAKARVPAMVTQEMMLQEAQYEVLAQSSMPRLEDSARTEAETGDVHLDKRPVEGFRPAPFSTRKIPAGSSSESSMLALANFKRRPRQPSILQIGRQDTVALESELDDMLDDFHPDDESTPFHIKSLDASSRPVTINSANNLLNTITSSVHRQIDSSRKRKLTPPRVQVPNSQSSPDCLLSPPSQPANEHALYVHTSSRARIDESDPDLPSNKPRPLYAETAWSDIMAPPESSSPPHWPDISITTYKSGPNRKHTDRELKNRSASTFIPSKSRSQPLKSISTATLQNLLPRRHHRPATRASDEFDIEDNSDVELDPPPAGDEDELSYAAPTGGRRAPKQNRKPMQSTKLAATVKKKKKPGKTTHKAHMDEDSKGTSVVKTYSRRFSDKENISANSDGMRFDKNVNTPHATISKRLNAHYGTGKKDEVMHAKAKTDLKTLAKKFKEVDEWEMEFEEVTASSSSPRDAR